MESIGRNPNSADRIFVPMIIGLALMEALCLYALVIAFFLKGRSAELSSFAGQSTVRRASRGGGYSPPLFAFGSCAEIAWVSEDALGYGPRTDAPKLLVPESKWWWGKEAAVEAISGAARGMAFAAGQFTGGQRVLARRDPDRAAAPEPAAAAAIHRSREPRRADGLGSPARNAATDHRQARGDGYLIMAGERRYRAAKAAGLSVIPAIVRDDDPNEIALIENLQREDLTALEEAEGLGAMVARYGYTHQALAQLLHKSRPYVSNTLGADAASRGSEGRAASLPDRSLARS